LKAQLTKYEDVEFEDKHGVVSKPVVNDVDALHAFTNLSKPVDFAGRLVYDADGDPSINFGKHKGKKVVDVFEVEPSYYAWMQNGDFPLYTKKVLEGIWNEYKNKKKEARTNTPVQSSNPVREPNRQDKRSVPSKPITNDMLKGLQDKFKK